MPAEKLKRILDLEAEKLEDRAIVGGLGAYAETWLQDADRAYGAEGREWAEAIAHGLRRYGNLSERATRGEAIRALLSLVDGAPATSAGAQAEAQVSARRLPAASRPRT